MRLVVIVFTLMLPILQVFAQNDEVIRVKTALVRLNVGVVDQKGRPVFNLSKEDFSVYEDGVKQSILRFEPTESPFSIVLLLDMSGSTISIRQTIKTAAIRFINALSAEDRVAVVEFYDKINLRNNFTTDRKVIFNSINVANGRGKTQLYKAIDFALDKLEKEKSSRKAIIVLTDGVDTDLRNNDREMLSKLPEDSLPEVIEIEKDQVLSRIITKAQQQGVTIYPLALPTGDPSRLPDPSPLQIALYKIARNRLEALAKNTGTSLISINRIEELGKIYASVAAEIRTLYTIEYQPTNDKFDGKWRSIKIQVSDPSLTARTKPGYYAK
ncbi:MAG: VWA domain-containing protein [Pyrinomonadaceae bacterium]|nr:VWA domain-containing protein [Pyrinomonadaceae bacterium]